MISTSPIPTSSLRWIRLSPTSDIPLHEGRVVQIADRSIAVFHASEGFRAIENQCPHRGGPLADGIVAGMVVTCPLHNWRVCLETGVVLKPCEGVSAGVKTFPLEIRDGILYLGLDDLGQEAAA